MGKVIINNFTEGPLFWRMLRFSIPFMLSNALQVLYSMADMLIVGRFVGSHGLAAISISSQAIVFMTMICLGFSTGGQVFISQLIGRGDRARLNSAIGTLFSLIMLAGCGATVFGLLVSKSFLRLLGTPPEAFGEAMDYMIVCSAGILFVYGYNMVSAVLRGMGDSKHPFLFIVIASVMNIVLDLLFIAGFGWSVFGAALATILSQAFSFLFAIVYLYRRKESFGFDFRLRSFRIDRGIMRILFKLGVPFAIRFGAINISMLYVNSLVNSLGVHASATFGVGMRLDDLVNKISQGVMMAVSTIVGQNIGAGKVDRVRRGVYYAWCICGIFFLIYSIFLLNYPSQMYGFFTDDPEVRRLAPVFVSAIVLHYPALLIMKGTNGFVQGIGNAVFGLIIALLDGFVFRVVLSWLFGIYFSMGLYGFILGYAMGTYATAVPSLIYFLFIPWYKRKLVIE